MSLHRRLVLPPLLVLTAVVAVAAPAHAAGPAYTALGDSYSSGTGTRTYYTDSGSCQRSPYAYPVLDAARLGAILTFAACAGATVSTVLNGQLAGLTASTSYVTLSAGGNDIGWVGVITQCAKPWPYTCETEIGTAENQIRTVLPGRLDQLYSRIRTLAPTARVVVVGYPRLFNGEECNLLTRISPTEQAELNAAADLLATTTRDRATAHGFGFVDARGPFTGHAVCDDVEWVNGLSSPIGESYHPNRAGHVAYAGLVESALRPVAVAQA
jgi:lysophospholipase L1-like esterase